MMFFVLNLKNLQSKKYQGKVFDALQISAIFYVYFHKYSKKLESWLKKNFFLKLFKNIYQHLIYL